MLTHVPVEWDRLVRSRTGVHQGRSGEGSSSVAGGQHGVPECMPLEEVCHGPPAQKRKRRNGSKMKGCDVRGARGGAPGGSGCSSSVKTSLDVCEGILQGINGTVRPDSNDGDCDLNLDYILSRVPYKQMLEDLFGTTGSTPTDVPVVSRAYEEQFMREPRDSSERLCVMGTECECNFIDRSNPFTCMEFLLPDESLAGDPQMCVLCHRRFVQSMFHNIVYAGKQFRGVIQRYGNICGHEGEYAREVALICPPNGPTQCMPLPAISHQRNKYAIRSIAGVRHVVQINMSPKDFQRPPRGVH